MCFFLILFTALIYLMHLPNVRVHKKGQFPLLPCMSPIRGQIGQLLMEMH